MTKPIQKPKPQYEAGVVRSMDEVPAGYEKQSWFSYRVPGKREAQVQGFLSRAYTAGVVPGVKVVRNHADLKCGPVYLDREVTIKHLEAHFGVTFKRHDEREPVVADDTAAEMRVLASEMRAAVTEVKSLAADLRAAVELLEEKANDTSKPRGLFNGMA